MTDKRKNGGTTVNVIPPEILQNFNQILLVQPCPKFCDTELDLLEIFTKILVKIEKKNQNNQTEHLQKEFLDLYERIKNKKEDTISKVPNETEEPFYRIECTDRRNEKILIGLRYSKGFARSLFFRKPHSF